MTVHVSPVLSAAALQSQLTDNGSIEASTQFPVSYFTAATTAGSFFLAKGNWEEERRGDWLDKRGQCAECS